MIPDTTKIALLDNRANIEQMLNELVLNPRRDFIRWAALTKQTPNMKIGYPGQHLASLISGMEGERTGARGHDLSDGSEVKSCSRVDQLDKCKQCKAAVARIEEKCSKCNSADIKRNNDSKWLFTIKSEAELTQLLDDVPRIILILSDYPNFQDEDWETIQFQAFEVWPRDERHVHFRTLMENYFRNIYLSHIAKNPKKTPAPKNFWPYSFQFYMCNPICVFHSVVTNANTDPVIDVRHLVDPEVDRATIDPAAMPLSVLNAAEKSFLSAMLDNDEYRALQTSGLSAEHRKHLQLRDTDHASPQSGPYHRGSRS